MTKGQLKDDGELTLLQLESGVVLVADCKELAQED